MSCKPDEYEYMEEQILRFIENYEGKAIGQSVKNMYENRQDIESIYEQIEDFGY